MDGLRIALFHNLHSGGAKRTLYEEVSDLTARHHVSLYTLDSADRDFCDLRPHVDEVQIYDYQPGVSFRSPLGRLNQGVRWLDLARLKRLAERIAADIDAGGHDVVLVHPCQYTQSPFVLRFLRTPSVYYCHEPLRTIYETPPARPYRRGSGMGMVLDTFDPLLHLYRKALRRADWLSLRSARLVLVNSRFTRENVHRIYGVDAVVCHHGVDTKVFRPLDLPRDGFVLSVGALTPNKGFDTLIEGMAALPVGRRPPLCLISNYAERQERAYLEQLADERQVHLNVRLQIGDDELVEAYNQAALVAYTPHREPLGLVPLESMACATAVVGVKEGGVQETVRHGETGLLVERRPEDVARALGELLDDPALADQMGQAGRRIVETEWDWPHAVRSLEGHLAAVA